MARSPFSTVFGLVALAGVIAVGAAGAVNVPSLPNPSFEQTQPCAPLPDTTICGWNSLVGTLTQNSTFQHTGSFSMKITDPGGDVEATTTNGICVTPISPGTHVASFWYMTDAPVITVQLGAHWYPNANCSVATFANSALSAATPLTYGAWTQATGTMTAPPTTGSAFFSVFASCQCSSATVTAYFDDVDFQSATAVTLVSLTAARSPNGVLVRWRTGTEADTLGFHVYRERAGRRVRVDRRLVPAKGSVSGARYVLRDSRAPRGKLTYRLQAVGTDGSRTWYGRASVGG